MHVEFYRALFFQYSYHTQTCTHSLGFPIWYISSTVPRPSTGHTARYFHCWYICIELGNHIWLIHDLSSESEFGEQEISRLLFIIHLNTLYFLAIVLIIFSSSFLLFVFFLFINLFLCTFSCLYLLIIPLLWLAIIYFSGHGNYSFLCMFPSCLLLLCSLCTWGRFLFILDNWSDINVYQYIGHLYCCPVCVFNEYYIYQIHFQVYIYWLFIFNHVC